MTTWDRGLVKVVNAASAAATDPGCWETVLSALGERFGATATAIFAPATSAKESHVLSASLNLPADSLQSYLEHWVPHDPWLAAARRSPMGSGNCHIGRELCDWPDLERSAFYNEFTLPQGVRGLLSLVVDDGAQPATAPFTLLSLYRAPGLEEFSFGDRQAMQAVHAPLQMAVRAYCAFGALRNAQLAAAAALDAVEKPIFVLDCVGRVLYSNVAAAAGAACADWLVIRGGRLVQLVSTPIDAAPTLVGRAVQGQLQTVRLWKPVPSGGVRCAIARLVPLAEGNACRWAWPDGAVLLLIDEQMPHSNEQTLPALSLRYRLTATEGHVMAQLGEGLSIADIAAANGVSIHTVRTHVKHLFEKTGVGRQGDLIRLIAGVASCA